MAKQTFTTGSVLTATQMNNLQANDYNWTVSQKTASYVLVAADAGTRIEMNSGSSTTITVNTGLFAAGDTLFIQNIGAGATTITAGTATVNKATAGSLTLAQYQGGTLYFVSASNAVFFADAGYTPPLTTKGDLFGYDTAAARIPIGTNGQVLTADSTQALGLKWATAGASTYSGVSLYSTTAPSCASGAATALTWDTEDFDTDGFHSTVSQTSRITIPSGKAGKYLLIVALNANDASTTGGRRIYFYKNGSILKTISFLPGSAIYPSFNGSMIVDLAVGDYVEVYYEQNSGTTQSPTLSSQYGHFSASLIGA